MTMKDFNTSILNKSYDSIYETLNRNIGSVDYKQEYGNNMGNVAVIENYNPLSRYISEIRNNFSNYIEYAQSLNPELTFFNSNYPIDYFGGDILKTSTKSYLYDKYLETFNGLTLRNALDTAVNFVHVDTDETYSVAYDKLQSNSSRYISYVNQLMEQSNVNGEYQFGVGNVNGVQVQIPHQLTRGYSYASLKGDIHDGISANNNVGTVFGLDVSFNIPFTTFILENNTDYPTYSDNNLTDDTIGTFNISNIKNAYGVKLDAVKGFESLFSMETESDFNARYTIDTKSSFVNSVSDKIIKVYNEAYDHNSALLDNEITHNAGKDATIGIDGLHYTSLSGLKNKNDLMAQTNMQFRNGKYKTMIARFGSYAQGSGAKDEVLATEYDTYHTAVSNYGTSHGRNLLRHKDNRQVSHNGGKMYNDPYCRVWTNYHEYSHYRNLIRPFMEEEDDEAVPLSDNVLYRNYGFNRVRSKDDGFGNGQERLSNYGVMNGNNFVNITPKIEEDTLDFETKTKQCMFSIENLAWKGSWMKGQEEYGLSKEQQGPFGGRIMWFPPYGLTFSEQVRANWSNTSFIGRGEPIYTYTDTVRSGSLNFVMLIDHPSILNEFKNSTSNDTMGQNDDEHNILRFFAGCGFPELKPERITNNDKNKRNGDDSDKNKNGELNAENNNQNNQKNENDKLKDGPNSPTGEFAFMVYYPNNYSGIRDAGNDGKGVDPMTYLINGVAAQKSVTIDENGKETVSDIPTDPRVKNYINASTNIGYEINGYNTSEKDGSNTTGVSWLKYTDLINDVNVPSKKDTKYLSLGNMANITDFEYEVTSKFEKTVTSSITRTIKYETISGATFTKTIKKTWTDTYTDKSPTTPKQTSSTTTTYVPEEAREIETDKVISDVSKTSGPTTRYSCTGASIKMVSSGTTKYTINATKVKVDGTTEKLSGGSDIVAASEEVKINSGKTKATTTTSKNSATTTSNFVYEINMTSDSKDDYEYNVSFSAKEMVTKKYAIPDSLVYTYTNKVSKSVAAEGNLNIYPITNFDKNKKYTNRWWYRIDPDEKSKTWTYKEQVLSSRKCYIDTKDYGLNSIKGIDIVKNHAADYKLTNPENIYSFLEVYIVLSKESDKLKENFKGLYDEKNIDTLKNILNEHKIKEIQFEGYASLQGHSSSNVDLANNRSIVLMDWTEDMMKDYEDIKFNLIKQEVDDSKMKTDTSQIDESEILAKLGRCAKAVVIYDMETVKNKADDTDSTILGNVTESGETIEKVGVHNPIVLPKYSLNALKKFYDNVVGYDRENFNLNGVNSVKQELKGRSSNLYMVKNNLGINDVSKKNIGYTRYDNEYEFFKHIDVNNSFIRNKIVEKVQYFDPAYHSITPEGFNSRLTFLHQCTRQGPTCGNSEIGVESKTADNLAFGRQPVCILRIGDFYNTKIIIDNISITYDKNGINWDLNSEGIGVQPMYAEISISFTFLGGSDLSGPISRLQNAVSFNYYANTGVYDNRSEQVEYDDEGKLVQYKTFNPLGNKIKTTKLKDK